MWQVTHERTFPGLKKEAVWAAWADVDNWHLWDRDIEYAKLQDGFREGGSFILKPKGGPKVKIRFQRVAPLQGYTDITKFPLATMYGIHDLEETPAGLKMAITIRVEGPLAWMWRKIVAQGVANDAPAQIESLAAFARAARE